MLGIIRIIGILLFVYLTWRNLRENYEEEKVVTYSWLALLGFFIGGRITYGLVNFGVWNDSWVSWFSVWDKPGMNYIGAFLILMLVGFIFAKANSWKVIPFFEDGLINSMWLILFLIIDEFVRTRFSLEIGVYILFLILIMFLAKLMKKKYRSFVWYKSGKKGFVFLATVALSFLIMGILGIFFKISFIFSFLYWMVSLISLVGLCILGEVFDFLMVNKRK